MAQFKVYRNLDRITLTITPNFLDVQSDLLDELATRVAVPLRLASSF